MRRGEITASQAQAAARKLAQPRKRRDASLEKCLRQLLCGIEKILDPEFDKRAQKLNEIEIIFRARSGKIAPEFLQPLPTASSNIAMFFGQKTRLTPAWFRIRAARTADQRR
jgi:hypothetical protein